MGLRVVVVVVLLGLAAVVLGLSTGASSALNADDRALIVRTIQEAQGKDGSFGSLHESKCATRTLSLLKSKIPNAAGLCDATSKKLKGGFLNAAETQAAVTVLVDAGCKAQILPNLPQDKIASLKLQLASERTPLVDLAAAAAALRALESGDVKAAALSDAEATDVITRVLALQEADGSFRSSSAEDSGSSPVLAGLGLELIAETYTRAKLPDAILENIIAMSERVAGLIAFSDAANNGENYLDFSDEQFQRLQGTDLVLTGIVAVASHITTDLNLPNDATTQFAEFFVRQKRQAASGSVQDAYHLVHALSLLAKNPVGVPLVLSLTQTARSLTSKAQGQDQNVKVSVTNVMGEFATAVSVRLLRAFVREDAPLITGQDLFAVSNAADNSLYQFNLMAAKPDSGRYTMEFRVAATSKAKSDTKFVTIDSATRAMLLTSAVAVSDCSLAISDVEADADDSFAEHRNYPCEFPQTPRDHYKADALQRLSLSFKIKSGSSGKPVAPQQVFVRLSSGHKEVFIVAKNVDNKNYLAQLDVEKVVARSFDSKSGEYRLDLIVGDSFVENPFQWRVALLNISVPAHPAVPSDEDKFYGVPAEIHHKFRAPEKRPTSAMALVFSFMVAAPVVILLVGLLASGVNLANFPMDGRLPIHLCFQMSLLAFIALYVGYFVKLNVFQTFAGIAVVGLVAIISGYHVLRDVDAAHSKSD